MKYFLRMFLFQAFALWLISQTIPGIQIKDGWQGMLFTALVLSILMVIIKPLLKILFIPINIMTFGLFSWTINVFVMYLLTFLVPSIIITPWNFSGFTYAGFVIPDFHVTYILSLTGITIALTILTNIFQYLHE